MTTNELVQDLQGIIAKFTKPGDSESSLLSILVRYALEHRYDDKNDAVSIPKLCLIQHLNIIQFRTTNRVLHHALNQIIENTYRGLYDDGNAADPSPMWTVRHCHLMLHSRPSLFQLEPEYTGDFVYADRLAPNSIAVFPSSKQM